MNRKKLRSWMLICIFLTVTGLTAVAQENSLTEEQKSLSEISAAAAIGDLEELKPAIIDGLEAGLTVNEIKEVFIQLYAYAGFPRSLNAINTFMDLLEERRSRGIEDEEGATASPLSESINKSAYGAEVRAELAGREEIGEPSGFQVFAPTIDRFLREHLFADIFARDILDFQTRELATVSALLAMTGTDGQLRFHFQAAMNTGLTPEQLRECIQVVGDAVGTDRTSSAGSILNEVLGQSGAASNDEQKRQKKFSKESMKTMAGTADKFTGDVEIEIVFRDNETASYSGAYVTFEPGARTNWHRHPAGQHMIITSGTGLTGTRDGRILSVEEGDAVWCPSNLDHWHGATPNSSMTHFVITGVKSGENVVWKEKVTEEQYEGNTSE